MHKPTDRSQVQLTIRAKAEKERRQRHNWREHARKNGLDPDKVLADLMELVEQLSEAKRDALHRAHKWGDNDRWLQLLGLRG